MKRLGPLSIEAKRSGRPGRRPVTRVIVRWFSSRRHLTLVLADTSGMIVPRTPEQALGDDLARLREAANSVPVLRPIMDSRLTVDVVEPPLHLTDLVSRLGQPLWSPLAAVTADGQVHVWPGRLLTFGQRLEVAGALEEAAVELVRLQLGLRTTMTADDPLWPVARFPTVWAWDDPVAGELEP